MFQNNVDILEKCAIIIIKYDESVYSKNYCYNERNNENMKNCINKVISCILSISICSCLVGCKDESVPANGVAEFSDVGVVIPNEDGENQNAKISSINVNGAISKNAELITMKYEYESFGDSEIAAKNVDLGLFNVDIPFTEDHKIFTYGGTICVGFDLKDVEPIVDEEKLTITVNIPAPQILSHTEKRENQKVYSIKNNIFNSEDQAITDFENLKAEYFKKQEEKILSDEKVMADAVDQFKTICESWLNNCDGVSGNYEIVFVEPEKNN